MSFESFAQSLAYMLINEHGGVEGPEMEIYDFPAHKVVSTQLSNIIITKGDGLTADQIKRHPEQITVKLNSGTSPRKPHTVCLIYVFEQPCPQHMKKEISALGNLPFLTFKTRTVFGGYADLHDGRVLLEGDLNIATISQFVTKTMKLFQNGELNIEGEDTYREALVKIAQSHNEFAERLSSTTPWATYTLTALCVLMFLWESISGGSSNSMMLLRMGANSSALVSNGEWWRTVGSMFLHGNFIHLFMNMYALVAVGTVLERYLGNLRFLALYTLSGIAGSLASVMMGTPLSVGASGAIFGLFGAAALIGYRYRNEIPVRFRNQLAGGMAINIFYNLIYGLSHQGIDNAAHVGGTACRSALCIPRSSGSYCI
ncbi:MAG: rhomboid family intramembrane serine protease [Candidatus Xenobiia bacterium LiM19]